MTLFPQLQCGSPQYDPFDIKPLSSPKLSWFCLTSRYALLVSNTTENQAQVQVSMLSGRERVRRGLRSWEHSPTESSLLPSLAHMSARTHTHTYTRIHARTHRLNLHQAIPKADSSMLSIILSNKYRSITER